MMAMAPGGQMLAPAGAVNAQSGPSADAPAGCTTILQAAQRVPDLSTFASYLTVRIILDWLSQHSES